MSNLTIRSFKTDLLITRGGDISGLAKGQTVTVSNMASFQAKVRQIHADKAEVEFEPLTGDFSVSIDVV